MNVYEKLQAARIQLQTAPLKKTGHNKFAGYYYFELGDFLPTIQEIFSELKLCGIVSYTSDTAFLEIVDMEDTSGKIVITSPMGSAALKGCHEVQNIGAVETYQRRYLWVTAMEIVEHDVIEDATTKTDSPTLLHKPSAGAYEGLSDPQKTEVCFIRDNILNQTANGEDLSLEAIGSAYNLASVLDNDQKIALTDMLGKYSKLRRALKDYKATLTEKKEAA